MPPVAGPKHFGGVVDVGLAQALTTSLGGGTLGIDQGQPFGAMSACLAPAASQHRRALSMPLMVLLALEQVARLGAQIAAGQACAAFGGCSRPQSLQAISQ